MIVRYDGGLDLTLILKDKEEAERTGQLSAEVIQCPQWKKARVVLNIVDELPEREPGKHYMMEEPGFHIEGKPEWVGPAERTEYTIYFSKANFKKLVSERSVMGGHFASRCLFDRTEFHFYAL